MVKPNQKRREFETETHTLTTLSILLVRRTNAKGSVSGFKIAPPSKGGGCDKHVAVD